MAAPPEKAERRRIRDYENVDLRKLPTRAAAYLHLVENRILNDFLPCPEEGRLLIDLGCGYGRHAPLYLQRYRAVVMVDYATSQLEEAAAAFGSRENVLFVAADARRLPLQEGVADGALAFRLFHHVENLDGLFAEVKRVLAPGGRFLFSYTSKRTFREMLRFVLGKTHHRPFTKEHLEADEMLFHTHPALMKAVRGAHGFSEVKTWNVGLFHQIWGRLPWRWAPPVSWTMFLLRLTGWLRGYALTYVHASQGSAPPKARHTDLAHGKDSLACPRCGAFPLRDEIHALACPACSRKYPLLQGSIYDFRLPEEAALEAVFDWRRNSPPAP